MYCTRSRCSVACQHGLWPPAPVHNTPHLLVHVYILVCHSFVSGTPGQNPTPTDLDLCVLFLVFGMLVLQDSKACFDTMSALQFLRRRSCRVFFATATVATTTTTKMMMLLLLPSPPRRCNKNY